MKVTYIVEQSGKGLLTVGELAALSLTLENRCPPDAGVFIQTDDSQREGRAWRARVRWEEETP